MPKFEEDMNLLEEYSRYVRATSGIPDDFDTWVSSEYGESRKRSHQVKKYRGREYDF